MRLVEINWSPTNRQLRQFGIICLFALPLVGWLWGGSLTVLAGLAAVGLVLATVGVAFPIALKPIFLALTILVTPIGMVIGEVAMLLIFFGVFLPIGVIFRLVKRDALKLKVDQAAESYWQDKKQPSSAASYYRQS